MQSFGPKSKDATAAEDATCSGQRPSGASPSLLKADNYSICGYTFKAVIILLSPLQEVKLLNISLDSRSKGGGLKSLDTI